MVEKKGNKQKKTIRKAIKAFMSRNHIIGSVSAGGASLRPRGEVYTGSHSSGNHMRNRRKLLKKRAQRRQKAGRPVR
jgi:hypothetical protein